MSGENKAPAPKIPNGMKFVLGGAAGMGAAFAVQPFDLVKTRMQISAVGSAKKEYKNTYECIMWIVKREGPLALYKGVGAALLRQASYTTVRLGVYTYLNDFIQARTSKEPALLVKMLMGVTAGACGAFVGTPAEVALIRMTSDGRLPKEQQRRYKNVVNALVRITKEEGVATLWRGCIPTVIRAMVVNMAQLASYSQAKSFFIKSYEMKEGLKLHFVSAMISGLITTAASMPVDIAKTRIQNMKYIDGKPEYTSAIDVITKVLRKEGVFSLWKGFTPYYCRLGPNTVLLFIFLENLNKAYFKYVLKTTGGSNL